MEGSQVVPSGSPSATMQPQFCLSSAITPKRGVPATSTTANSSQRMADIARLRPVAHLVWASAYISGVSACLAMFGLQMLQHNATGPT